MTEMTTKSATYSYGLVFISSISFRTKKVHKKSNELIAIPELIELLEIAGSVKTIEARLLSKRHNISDYKDITSLIIKKKVDYILALKGNQKLLYQAVKQWFEVAKKKDYLGRD